MISTDTLRGSPTGNNMHLESARGRHFLSVGDTLCGMNDQERIELEAATFRALVTHLRERTDVQNIDLMNLAGFCRNCLAKWYMAAASDEGIALSKGGAREIIYGMPYEEWKAAHQTEASPAKLTAHDLAHEHPPPAPAPEVSKAERVAQELRPILEEGLCSVWRLSSFMNGAGRVLWLSNTALVSVHVDGRVEVQGPRGGDHVELTTLFLQEKGWL